MRNMISKAKQEQFFTNSEVQSLTTDGRTILFEYENGEPYLIPSEDTEITGGILLPHAQEPINLLKYGSPERVRLRLYQTLGCRPCETDDLPAPEQCIFNNILYFKTRKKQNTQRKEHISDDLIKEILYMREEHKVKGSKMFPYNSETFRRIFNRDIRPRLSIVWQIKIKTKEKKGASSKEYLYSLYGYRRNFSALKYEYYLNKTESPQLATVMTQKSMKHKTEFMTLYHYASVSHQINAKRYAHLLNFDKLEQTPRQTLLDFIA